MPVSAIISGQLAPVLLQSNANFIYEGPLVGESWDASDLTPLSISKEYFKSICPTPYILHGERARAIHGDGASAQKIVETWIKLLAEIEDPCVEVPEDSGPIFHP